MNTTPHQPDDSLHRALQAWEVSATLPPRFQENVWRRIEQAESSRASVNAWQTLVSTLAGLVLRPRLAYSCLTAALAIGLFLGYRQAREDTSAMASSLGQRYVQSVDPYHKPGQL